MLAIVAAVKTICYGQPLKKNHVLAETPYPNAGMGLEKKFGPFIINKLSKFLHENPFQVRLHAKKTCILSEKVR